MALFKGGGITDPSSSAEKAVIKNYSDVKFEYVIEESEQTEETDGGLSDDFEEEDSPFSEVDSEL